MRCLRSPLPLVLVVLGVLLFLPACKKKSAIVTPPTRATSNPAPANNPPAPAPTIDLSANPTTVDRGGTTTLNWSSSNATSVVIDNGVGNVSQQGSIVISPRDSVTYTAVARGGGQEARDSARVTVVMPSNDITPVSTDRTLLEQLQENGQLKDVFFAYDKADLSAESRETLRLNARLFRDHPQARIVVEGHCDERGTEAYNLALGDRRAQAVYDYLIQLGLPAGRMETISYGEERPFAMGTDERSYALNRRAHFSFR